MTNTKQFIKDSIEGGWNEYDLSNFDTFEEVAFAFYDSSFWKSVRKTSSNRKVVCPACIDIDEWTITQFEFIPHTQDGKTIEEALTEIV